MTVCLDDGLDDGASGDTGALNLGKLAEKYGIRLLYWYDRRNNKYHWRLSENGKNSGVWIRKDRADFIYSDEFRCRLEAFDTYMSRQTLADALGALAIAESTGLSSLVTRAEKKVEAHRVITNIENCLNNPDILAKVRKELFTSYPDSIPENSQPNSKKF